MKYLFILSLIPGLSSLFSQTSWVEHPQNPIITKSFGWESGIVLSPSVILHNDTLKMWYTGSTSLFNPASIGYAWSLDGINWTKYNKNPVMKSRTNEWDNSGIAVPIVILDGDSLRMWYGSGLSPDNFDIGYAISADGINWKRFSKPALQRGPDGEWNADILSTGTVIKEDGEYKMWFSGGVGSLNPANQFTKTSIGYATSQDGLNWTIYDDPATKEATFLFSDPVLEHGPDGAWDTNETFSASVLKTESGYNLWYSGWKAGSSQNIGFATSNDGINWTRYQNNPVLFLDPLLGNDYHYKN